MAKKKTAKKIKPGESLGLPSVSVASLPAVTKLRLKGMVERPIHLPAGLRGMVPDDLKTSSGMVFRTRRRVVTVPARLAAHLLNALPDNFALDDAK